MQFRRRSVTLLLLLATLTALLVSLLPFAASADPVGDYASDIQNFGYQTLSNANQTDATTDLRVMFTIGSLEYDLVGFVFSTSDPAPTAGGSGTYVATTVYRSINTGSGDVPAGTGRYWVAVKLHDIPLSAFETTIYIRPFIKDGENYSYIDAAAITVCQALTIDKTVAGESTIYNSKSPTGHAYESGDDFQISQTIADIRGKDTPNEKHFFPTNDGESFNQLYIEYSFLWNETFANATNARMSLAWFGGWWGDREMFGLYVKNGDGRSAGSFDLCSGLTNLWGHNTNLVTGPKEVANYPTLGNRYGWHRIGIVFQNEVLSTPKRNNTNRAKADGHKVEYYGFIDLYIDGERVWHCRANIQGNWVADEAKTYKGYWDNNDGFRAKRALTFLASGAGSTTGDFVDAIEYNGENFNGVTFVDLDTVTVNMTIDDVANSTNAVYIAVSDVQYTCGTDFRRNVSPVADPVDRTIVLDDNGTADPADDVTCSGKIWYVFDN